MLNERKNQQFRLIDNVVNVRLSRPAIVLLERIRSNILELFLGLRPATIIFVSRFNAF